MLCARHPQNVQQRTKTTTQNWKDADLTFQYQYILKTSEEQTYSIHIWHRPAGTGDLIVVGNRVTNIFVLFQPQPSFLWCFNEVKYFTRLGEMVCTCSSHFVLPLVQHIVQISVVALILLFSSECWIPIWIVGKYKAQLTTTAKILKCIPCDNY